MCLLNAYYVPGNVENTGHQCHLLQSLQPQDGGTIFITRLQKAGVVKLNDFSKDHLSSL